MDETTFDLYCALFVFNGIHYVQWYTLRRDERIKLFCSKCCITKNSLTSQNGKKRIFAVDDNPDITTTIKTGLEDTGLFQVDTFNDPVKALASFKPGLYDLALLDFKRIRRRRL